MSRGIVFLAGALLALGSCAPGDRGTLPAGPSTAGPAGGREALRARMAREIREAGVADEAVLAALSSVPRHEFVPPALSDLAYELRPLPIGEEQTISDPYIVGLMTELLALTGREKVLEIGTGSGYQAAVLARLVPRVYSIEIRPSLAESARRRLSVLGYTNVTVRCGDGYRGWPSEAPFDAIIVTAAPPQLPAALVDQLAPGGRLVVPVGGQEENQMLTVVRKDAEGRVTEEQVAPVRFVPMVPGER